MPRIESADRQTASELRRSPKEPPHQQPRQVQVSVTPYARREQRPKHQKPATASRVPRLIKRQTLRRQLRNRSRCRTDLRKPEKRGSSSNQLVDIEIALHPPDIQRWRCASSGPRRSGGVDRQAPTVCASRFLTLFRYGQRQAETTTKRAPRPTSSHLVPGRGQHPLHDLVPRPDPREGRGTRSDDTERTNKTKETSSHLLGRGYVTLRRAPPLA